VGLSDNTQLPFVHAVPPMRLGTPLIRYESNHLRHEKFIKSCCKNPEGCLCLAALHLQGMGAADAGTQPPQTQQSQSRSLSLGLLAHDSMTQGLKHLLSHANTYREEAWAMAPGEPQQAGNQGGAGKGMTPRASGLAPDEVGHYQRRRSL